MKKLKGLLSLLLVFTFVLSLTTPVEAKAKTVKVKSNKLSYVTASITTGINEQKKLTYYILSKAKKSGAFTTSYGKLVKGKEAYFFNKAFAKKITKYQTKKKDFKITYDTVSKNSKYYDKFFEIRKGELMTTDMFALLALAYSEETDNNELKELFSKLNQEGLSEEEQLAAFLEVLSIFYQTKGEDVTFTTIEDYDAYINDKAEASIGSWLKKIIVVTEVVLVK